MTSAIIVINRRNPKLRYIVRVADWINPRMYVIDAQIPYIGDTAVLYKDEYMAGGFIDESGDEEYFVKGGE